MKEAGRSFIQSTTTRELRTRVLSRVADHGEKLLERALESGAPSEVVDSHLILVNKTTSKLKDLK